MIIGSKDACTTDYMALLSSNTTIWTLQNLSLRAKWQERDMAQRYQSYCVCWYGVHPYSDQVPSTSFCTSAIPKSNPCSVGLRNNYANTFLLKPPQYFTKGFAASVYSPKKKEKILMGPGLQTRQRVLLRSYLFGTPSSVSTIFNINITLKFGVLISTV